LLPYENSGDIWIEDKVENAVLGRNLGLNSILIEHGFNMNISNTFPMMRNWKDVYEYVTG
jgi:hypothetical protein